jgi:hypothetical protein
MSPRPYAAAAAALLAAPLVLLATAHPAQALPPTTRTLKDAVEPGKAFDVVGVTMRSAPTSNRPAVVKITHGRTVTAGDVVEVWFDLDDDLVPDLHLTGYAESEYVVKQAKSFTQDGKDITEQDCVRLSMGGRESKVKLFPECVDSPLSYAVAVKSSVGGRPEATDDWAPGTERFSKRVLAAPLS